MAVVEQEVTDRYALYNGDCVEVMQKLPAESIDLTVYSPPFAGLYQYSSDERDMSNAIDKDDIGIDGDAQFSPTDDGMWVSGWLYVELPKAEDSDAEVGK